MKVQWRREPQSRAVLEVELPPEEVSKAVAAAHRILAQRVAIPGFRRGKAPRAILERYVGRESVIDETLKLLLPDGYARAVKEAGFAPIGRPQIDVTSEQVDEHASLRFTATVDIAPEVDPGPYRSVRVPREESAVGEGHVEAAIEDLRLRHGSLVSAGDDAAAQGDFVLIQVLEGSPGLPRLQTGKEYLVEVGGGLYPEALEHGLAGLRRGERRPIILGNPDDRVAVVAVDVKRRALPSLDDAFARQVGGETLEALRGQLRERLTGEAAQRNADAYTEAVLRTVSEHATVDLPRSLVAHEVEHLVSDLMESLRRRGLTLESYLRAADKTEEAMRTEFTAVAERRLRTRLVLEEIARRESIAPTEEEIAHEVENLAQSLQHDAARVREWLDEERRRDALVETLRRRKTVQFLVALASGPGVESKEDA